jgi:hypothetical protein
MEADDLLCSRNARPQKALVGRAQGKINQPPSLERNEPAWKEHYKQVLVRRAQSRKSGHSPFLSMCVLGGECSDCRSVMELVIA